MEKSPAVCNQDLRGSRDPTTSAEVSAYEGDIVIMGSDGVFDNLWPLFLAMDVLDGRDFLNIDYIYIICIYAPKTIAM